MENKVDADTRFLLPPFSVPLSASFPALHFLWCNKTFPVEIFLEGTIVLF